MQGFKKPYLPLMIAAALVAGCGDKLPVTEGGKGAADVAAKVNGTEITMTQVNHALQRIPNLDETQTKAASLQVVRKLVDQELLLQKAQADKLDRDPEVVQELDAARRQILAETYLSRKLGTQNEPSEAEVADYFNKHPELFAKRRIYRLQEILIQAPEDRHEAIRAQLAASKTLNDFGAWLKAENLPAQSAQGVKPAEQLPLEILPKLAEMQNGQTIVAQVPAGLVVMVKLDSQAQPVTLEQARPVIGRMLQTQARQKTVKAELDALRSSAKIEYMGEFAGAAKQ